MQALLARALLLAVALGFALQAQGSTCLRKTAPEVVPHLVTGDTRQLREAIAAIDGHASKDDAGLAAPWLTAQASMLLDAGAVDKAIEHLRRAIAGWLQNGRTDAEVCARHLLVFALTLKKQSRAALAETLLAETRAQEADLDEALNRLKQTHVTLLLTLNENLEQALVLMGETRPGSSRAEQINWHHIRGLMLSRLNRHSQAAREFERVIELAAEEAMPQMRAAARLNLANQLTRIGRNDPFAIAQDQVMELLHAVVSDAGARWSTRAMALRSLAQHKPATERAALLKQCEHLAKQAGDKRRQAVCRADRAEVALDDTPERAIELIEQAVALAESDPRALWQIQSQRLAVIWATQPPLTAFNSSLNAIDAERQLRDRQLNGPERAAFIDGLSWDYRRLVAKAYQHASMHPELARKGFELLAANRAMVLRERRLARDKDGSSNRIRELAERINQVQSVLLSSHTKPGEINRARAEIEHLEADWHKAAIGPPEISAMGLNSPAMAQLQRSLRSDEALLSFLTLIPGQPIGANGWLQVITSKASRLYPIPGDLELTEAADLLQGFANASQRQARQLLGQLARQLLFPALDDLSPQIRHLIIVPDRGIDKLPLVRLPTPYGAALGMRFSVDLAPSTGVWLDARQSAGTMGPVVALADPKHHAAGYKALDAAYPGQRPPRLPAAIDEVRRIRSMVGNKNVRTHMGDAATESVLKRPEAGIAGGLVHLATHTLIHPGQHDRSAVLLTPDRDGDGLLQPWEIERLKLDGTGVILSSCASATGNRLDNEGVISLARSFMIAGAPSVVATRQPVEDRHAEAFFQRFYWHLASGHSQSEAIRLARTDLHKNGYPDRAWAAWILYGDGRWQPLPAYPNWPVWAVIIGAVGLLILLLVKIR